VDRICSTHGDKGNAYRKWILEKQDRAVWTGFFWLRIIETNEHGIEPSDSIKCLEILE
jgi:hypothetical protein